MESTPASSVVASPRVKELLQRLHTLSETEEKSLSQIYFYLTRLIRFLIFGEMWSAQADTHMRDKFVALDAEKCQYIYLLARATRAYNVIEAGTSFGVSTVYLALAVGQNINQESICGRTISGKVIATEKEPTKAARARENWKLAGTEVEQWIELREGDLLETLRIEEGMPDKIDLLLLDSKLLSGPSLEAGVASLSLFNLAQFGHLSPSQL